MESTTFLIEKQESLVKDKFSKNGRTMDLHVVAKNIAFLVHLSASFDLNTNAPTAKLVYDLNDDEEKDVEAMKANPLEFIAHVDDTGRKAAVEVKIGVLSSQHEGAYFRVKFIATDPSTSTTFEEFTQPIKVMSKQNQVRKMAEKKNNKRNEPSSPSDETEQYESSKKRKIEVPTNAFAEQMNRMEEHQHAQTLLIEQLLRSAAAAQQPVVPTKSEEMDFDTLFVKFINAYHALPAEEKLERIRMASKTSGATECFTDIASVHGGSCSYSTDSSPCEKNCICQDCPHKKQLSKLDDFFHDFLSDPMSPESL